MRNMAKRVYLALPVLAIIAGLAYIVYSFAKSDRADGKDDDSARFALRSAEQALHDCTLKAPFSGRIADLVARPHQRGDKFCTLIDDSFFDVEFKILEAELVSVRMGTVVKVSPFVDNELSLTGAVTEINPSVDDKGLVTVKARVKNTFPSYHHNKF